jgi:hypothetical protein
LAIWCCEKALYATQSITDGGSFDLNEVVYTSRKLNDSNTLQLHRAKDLSKLHLRIKPLGGYDRIEWGTDNYLVFHKGQEATAMGPREALRKIDDLLLAHMKEQFPDLDVWNDTEAIDQNGEKPGTQFTFETKGVVKKAVFHGLTNYRFDGGYHEGYQGGTLAKVAMRSYSKSVDSEAGRFLNLLYEPERVPRQRPFYDRSIVKVGAYRARFKSHYAERTLIPGDTEHTVSWIHELSPSNFMYQSRAQRQTWAKWIQAEIEEKGQSAEGFFTEEKGQLNYQKMVEEFDQQIAQGMKNPLFTSQNDGRIHPNRWEYNEMKSFANDRSLKINHSEKAFQVESISENYYTPEKLAELEAELEADLEEWLNS